MNRHKLRLLIVLVVFVLLFLALVLALFSRMPLPGGGETPGSTEMSGHIPLPSSEDTGGNDPEAQAPPATTQPPTDAPTEEPTEETTEETTQETTEETTEATTVPETTVLVQSDVGYLAAMLAAEQLDKPYRYGTAGPDTFDTSGLLQYCFGQYGVSVPRSTGDQAVFGYEVAREEIRPGDAIFFWSSNPGEPEYVGIYIGNSIVVAALNDSKPVVEFNMETKYYTEHYVFARRFY